MPKKSIEKIRFYEEILFLEIFSKIDEFLGKLSNFQEILLIKNRMFPCRS
jgi:hypothetical protein